jgi:hypothetical protein
MIDAAQAECDRIFESVVLPVARHLKEEAALSPPRSPLSSMSVRRKSSTQW